MAKINKFSGSNKFTPKSVSKSNKLSNLKKSSSTRVLKSTKKELSKRTLGLKCDQKQKLASLNVCWKNPKEETEENQTTHAGATTAVNKKKKLKVKKIRNKSREIVEDVKEEPQPVRQSDTPIPKKFKWVNRQRVLMFGCRGISSRDRHLMKDLRKLMPHTRPENKMERRENLQVVNNICQMRHCNKCVLFEGRGGRDVYMWLSVVPGGPSIKFLLQNIYTMDELRFTGNCLVGSRPFLSFDSNFDSVLHYRIIREVLLQTFGTPNHLPKSQPFFDHVFSFSVVDNRIWFRNYQILSEDGALSEIGPRFIMNPVKIFEGSFEGKTLWENPHYVTPARLRQLVRKAASGKYVNRFSQKIEKEKKKSQKSYPMIATDEVFTENPWEKAYELMSKNTQTGGNVQTQKINKVKKPKGGLKGWNVDKKLKLAEGNNEMKSFLPLKLKKNKLNTSKDGNRELYKGKKKTKLNVVKGRRESRQK